jgi:UDP-N-acetylmuramyl pentapeptide phosphotransferase/UDP-N-acetylglucosamine-1-phosphate transferase
MKPYSLIGIILIVVAVAAFTYQGISYTTREKVVDLGPLQVTADKTRTLPLSPIVGGIALLSGIVLLVMGQKKG